MLHQSCDLGPIRAVTAKISATETGCDAEFRLDGRIEGIRLPDTAPSIRTDELWKTSCFEVFWQPIGGASYRELNLSPSTRWAAYDFDAFREGMREAPVDAIALAVSSTDTELVLSANIAADLPSPAQVALTAIVEHRNQTIQYWSLAFGPGRPDFHSEACRQLIVDR
ncbi:MAG: hypothetical protein AAF494_08970 [Pseudomonadota bacterium]